MTITIAGKSASFNAPIRALEAARQLTPEKADKYLGFFGNGVVVELQQLLQEDHDLTPLTYADEEGRRMYERSLRFVLLLAASRIYPHAQVRIEHSIGQGIYIQLHNMRLTPSDVLALEEEMRAIGQQNLPFTRHRWPKEKAIDYFTRRGDTDKAKLLGYRPYNFFDVYECGGMYEYFYGAMLPSTGMVNVFRLHSRAPGLVLLLPDQQDPTRAAPYTAAMKNMQAFAQSNYWCQVLGCSTAADLNDLIASRGLRDFIRVNEAFHEKSLADIAQDVIHRNARIIYIAGPSSSGKTTFANRLSIALRVNGYRPMMVSMDDFYLDRDIVPLEADGKPDLEALSALDVAYFRQCISQLLAGQVAYMPRFSFKTGKREEKLVPTQIEHTQPLIIEGIHGLNPALQEGFDPKVLCRIYISQLTCLNLDHHNRIRTTDARLLRRIVRDHQFRDTPATQTLAMWDSVRRGEEKWIFPYQEEADIVFNSALHYELPVLKEMAYDLLRAVPKSDPNYVRCGRLLKILNYFLPVDEETLREIPPLSILREFIGGNTLYTNH